jgi:hypothetical protein
MVSSGDGSNKDQDIRSTVPADDKTTNPSIHASKFRRGRILVFRFSVSTRLILDEDDREMGLEWNRCWVRGGLVSGEACKELSGEVLVLVGETRSLVVEDRLRSDIPKGVATGIMGASSKREWDNRLARRHDFWIVEGTIED